MNYEEKCKAKYLQKEDHVLYEYIKVDHDGYDQYGPKSNLYDYYVIIQRNNKILYEIFYRENWFSDKYNMEYECYPNIPFQNKITKNIYLDTVQQNGLKKCEALKYVKD